MINLYAKQDDLGNIYIIENDSTKIQNETVLTVMQSKEEAMVYIQNEIKRRTLLTLISWNDVDKIINDEAPVKEIIK